MSMWPEQQPYTHLLDLLDHQHLGPSSYRAASGFLERTQRAKLRFDPLLSSSPFILVLQLLFLGL